MIPAPAAQHKNPATLLRPGRPRRIRLVGNEPGVIGWRRDRTGPPPPWRRRMTVEVAMIAALAAVAGIFLFLRLAQALDDRPPRTAPGRPATTIRRGETVSVLAVASLESDPVPAAIGRGRVPDWPSREPGAAPLGRGTDGAADGAAVDATAALEPAAAGPDLAVADLRTSASAVAASTGSEASSPGRDAAPASDLAVVEACMG